MSADLEAIRKDIEARLNDGLRTEVMPRADTNEAVNDIISRLRDGDGSLETRLVIGGFTLTPIEYGGIEQACETCMYFLVHKKYCDLPELDLPAEPQWSCRLWRI